MQYTIYSLLKKHGEVMCKNSQRHQVLVTNKTSTAMSPYEMLRFWKAVKITAWSGSELTEAGIALKAKARKEGDTRPWYVAGQH